MRKIDRLLTSGLALSLALIGGAGGAVTHVATIDLSDRALDVAVDGAIAYVAAGPEGLRVVDASTPALPDEIGVLDTAGSAVDVEVAGGLAYVADLTALRIVDVSSPASPVELGALATPGLAVGVDVEGTIAYVADQIGGLLVIDVSDPAAPTELGSTFVPGVSGVEVAGGVAYVVAFDSGLSAFDVSDPASPALLGGADVLGIRSAAVADGLAYVGTVAELQVFDVSDPGAPVKLGAVGAFGGAQDVELANGRVYVAASGSGLQVFDASDPANVSRLGTFDTEEATGVAVAGSLAYVTDFFGELRLVDVSAPEFPRLLASIATPGFASHVAVRDGHAWVADSFAGLQAIDVSDPASPTSVGALDTPGDALGVELEDGLASLADGRAGLAVIDVSDPAQPVPLGALDTGNAADVVVRGGIAYVASGGLEIIDVMIPSAPARIASLGFGSGGATDVALVGETALVTSSDSGLGIVDVSDPAAPALLGVLDTPGRALGVAAREGLAFLADYDAFRVIDFSDPSAPVEIAALGLPLGAAAADVELAGGFAYVASGSSGVRAIDVSDPAAPREVGAVGTPGGAQDVEIADGLAYAASLTTGLHVLDFGPEFPVPPEVIEVAIDIQPGRRNVIRPRGHGRVRVTVLGSASLDVSAIDPTRLAFGPGEASPSGRPRLRDVDADGLPDLVARFRKRHTGIEPGDTRACLAGQLLDGTRFLGCDAIRVPPLRRCAAHAKGRVKWSARPEESGDEDPSSSPGPRPQAAERASGRGEWNRTMLAADVLETVAGRSELHGSLTRDLRERPTANAPRQGFAYAAAP